MLSSLPSIGFGKGGISRDDGYNHPRVEMQRKSESPLGKHASRLAS